MDRGSWSVEVILTLLAFKCVYPRHMHLTRGNHEAKSMNTIYGGWLGGWGGGEVLEWSGDGVMFLLWHELRGMHACSLAPAPALPLPCPPPLHPTSPPLCRRPACLAGFVGEVKAKYSALMSEVFRETFCWLPLGAVINNKVLVVRRMWCRRR